VKVGIIAEDDSDVAVLQAITLKMLKPKVVGFRSFVGNGCGKLRRKCGAWAVNLVGGGCPCIVVVHDLDEYDASALRTQLSAAIAPARARFSVVLIPKREIEAWLLYDMGAIAKAFRETKTARLHGNPENLRDPKGTLEDLVWKAYRKSYVNTVHNPQIAKHINITQLNTCKSFAPHPDFVAQLKKLL